MASYKFEVDIIPYYPPDTCLLEHFLANRVIQDLCTSFFVLDPELLTSPVEQLRDIALLSLSPYRD